jgi:hypothetical protein
MTSTTTRSRSPWVIGCGSTSAIAPPPRSRCTQPASSGCASLGHTKSSPSSILSPTSWSFRQVPGYTTSFT